MVVLEMARHYDRVQFEHETVQEAAASAIDDLDHDMAWPVSIIEDGQEVWRQNGPFGDCIDKLRELAA